MFDNIKASSHEAITKMISLISKEEPTEEDKQKIQNDTPIECSELIELHSKGLQYSEKILITMLFKYDLETKMTHEEFKAKLLKIKDEMKLEENQFKVDNLQPKKQSNEFMKKSVRIHKKKQPKLKQPSVDSYPQYYRIDQEICHKLFDIYKALPLGAADQGQKLSFDDKQKQNQCMNYQKVLQILKDAGITVQIHQRLQILRATKKFCINPNFMSQEEFAKVFKVIVHGLGYKEKSFQTLIEQNKKYLLTKKNKTKQQVKKNYKFKTEGGDRSMQRDNNVSRVLNSIEVRKKTESDARSRVLDGIKVGQNPRGKKGYLVKAMDADKISKITWQSLFSMNESSMHHNIVIPEIVRGKI